MILSNAPWCGSGYGEQVALLGPRLAKHGHEVAYAANFGLQARPTVWSGFPVFPANDNWGNPVIATLARYWQADVVIVLCDAWVMKPDMWDDDMPPVGMWAPIDHYPIPPAVLATLQSKRLRPIAMSQFGVDWMGRFGLEPLYAPHAVDTQIFYPRPEMRLQARSALGLPADAFVVGMVAANKGNPSFPRKGFPEAFDAFSQFSRNHDDAYLYVHTDPEPGGMEGINLFTLSGAMQCREDRVCFPPKEAFKLGVIDQRFMAELYQAFDVLLNPSWGEGFGVPIIEAQASGVPVIATNTTSMVELTEAGWLVGGQRLWDALQASFAVIPSVDGIALALEEAYEGKSREQMRKDAVTFANSYDADLVVENYWLGILEELVKPREVKPLGETRQVRRARERKERKEGAAA